MSTAAGHTSSDPALHLRLAPLVRRTVSLIYEALLVGAVLWCAGFLYALFEQGGSATHSRLAYQVYLLFVAGAYFTLQWRRGQTLPMKTWRMSLVTRTGGALSLQQAVTRYLLASAGLVLLGLGFWWALVDRDRQFLHDRLAGTRLVSQ